MDGILRIMANISPARAIPKRELRKLLTQHCGNVTLIARETGVPHSSLQNRIDRDPDLKMARLRGRKTAADQAQATLIDAAKNGNVQAAEKLLLYYGPSDGVIPANIQHVQLSQIERDRVTDALKATLKEFLPADKLNDAMAAFVRKLNEGNPNEGA